MLNNVFLDDAAWVKLDLLVHGVLVGESLSGLRDRKGFAARKNFYNDPVWQVGASAMPQELRIGDLVVGLNLYGHSPWRLEWNPRSSLLELHHAPTEATIHPKLVEDLQLFELSPSAVALANLYGGSALAFFSPRACYFFSDDTQCGFCSLAGTAAEHAGFTSLLAPDQVEQTVRAALRSDPGRVEQVMIVGGNMRDLDRGFRHHAALARAASTAIASAGATDTISVHVATMPPRDLGMIEELSDIPNLHVMFNLEVWDPVRFADVCPGKHADYGRNGMLAALERLRDVIGAYRAHSLLVTGLERPQTTLEGAEALAEMGVSPILNVYHSDRHSRFGLGARPTLAELADVARGLQELYGRLPMLPYWRRCGRNAIDAEAAAGMFRRAIPDDLLRQMS